MTAPLELRSWPFLALAYIAAAIAGGLIMVVETSFGYSVGDRSAGAIAVLWSSIPSLGVSSLVVLIAEIIFATPILAGFARYKWAWLNTATGALIGFLVGGGLMFVWSLQPMGDGSGESVGYFRAGKLTSLGFRHAITNGLSLGAVGVVIALTFRLIAVRSWRGHRKQHDRMP